MKPHKLWFWFPNTCVLTIMITPGTKAASILFQLDYHPVIKFIILNNIIKWINYPFNGLLMAPTDFLRNNLQCKHNVFAFQIFSIPSSILVWSIYWSQLLRIIPQKGNKEEKKKEVTEGMDKD